MSTLEPVRFTGPEQVVFDWSRDACGGDDFPDVPARAFRDARGTVRLIDASDTTRALVGPDLDHVTRRCGVAMRSALDPDPGRFAYKEWISGTYTRDGKTVYALVHDEFHGDEVQGLCPSEVFERCWYNAVTLARSDDGGVTFHHARPPPGHLVAAAPYRYEPDAGRVGVFAPSGIVAKGGYYYALVETPKYRLEQLGACLIRTSRLGDPASWRAWDGDGFGVEFADPYETSADPRSHTCTPVSPDEIGDMTQSLTYNTYFGKYLLVGSGTTYDPRKRRAVNGFYYSLSGDLIHWSTRKLIKEEVLPQTYRCGDPDPVLYPSALDPASGSRNFDTTGRRVFIYFTRYHYDARQQTTDRDLVRVPVEFSK